MHLALGVYLQGNNKGLIKATDNDGLLFSPVNTAAKYTNLSLGPNDHRWWSVMIKNADS